MDENIVSLTLLISNDSGICSSFEDSRFNDFTMTFFVLLTKGVNLSFSALISSIQGFLLYC